MTLFGRTPIADPRLRQIVGRRRVLASGRGAHGEVLGLAGCLIVPAPDGWTQLPWHEIATGGWDQQAQTLRWTTVDGVEGSVELTETGQLPDLFNERVAASIACVRRVDIAGGSAVITARRDLRAEDSDLSWRVSPGKGTEPSALDADPLVAFELERLRAEYDPE